MVKPQPKSRRASSPLRDSRALCCCHKAEASNVEEKNLCKISVQEIETPTMTFHAPQYKTCQPGSVNIPVAENNSGLLRRILNVPYTIIMFFLSLLARLRSFLFGWSWRQAVQKEAGVGHSSNASISPALRAQLVRLLNNRTIVTPSSAIVPVTCHRSLVPLSASSINRRCTTAMLSKPSYLEPIRVCLVACGGPVMVHQHCNQVPLNLTLPLKEFRDFKPPVHVLLRHGQIIRVTCTESFLRNAVKTINELGLPLPFTPRAVLMPQSSILSAGKSLEASYVDNRAMALPSSILKIQNVELKLTLSLAGLCEINARLCTLFVPECIVEVDCSNTNVEALAKCMRVIGLALPSKTSAVRPAIMPPHSSIVPTVKTPATSKPVYLLPTLKFEDAVRKFSYEVTLEKLKGNKQVDTQARCCACSFESEHKKQVSFKKKERDIQTLDTSVSEFPHGERNETGHSLSIQRKGIQRKRGLLNPTEIKDLEKAFDRFRKESNSNCIRSKPVLTSQSCGLHRYTSVRRLASVTGPMSSLASSDGGQQLYFKKNKHHFNILDTSISKSPQKGSNDVKTGHSFSIQRKPKDTQGSRCCSKTEKCGSAKLYKEYTSKLIRSKAVLSTPLLAFPESVETSSPVRRKVSTLDLVPRLVPSTSLSVLQSLNQAAYRDEVKPDYIDGMTGPSQSSQIKPNGIRGLSVGENRMAKLCKEYANKSISSKPVLTLPSFGFQESVAVTKQANTQARCFASRSPSSDLEKNQNVSSLVIVTSSSEGRTDNSTLFVERKPTYTQGLSGSDIEENGFAKYCAEYVSKSVSSRPILSPPVSPRPVLSPPVSPRPVLSPPSFEIQESARPFAAVNRLVNTQAQCSSSPTSSDESEKCQSQFSCLDKANMNADCSLPIERKTSEIQSRKADELKENGFAKYCKEYVNKSAKPTVLSQPLFGLQESLEGLAAALRQTTSQAECPAPLTSSLDSEKDQKKTDEGTELGESVPIERKSAEKQGLCTSDIEENGFAKYCKEYVSKSISTKSVPVLIPASFGLHESVKTVPQVISKMNTATQCSVSSTSSSELEKNQNKVVCLDKVKSSSDDSSASEKEENGFAKYCREYVSKSVKPKPVLPPPSSGLQESLEGLAAALKQTTSQAQFPVTSTSALDAENDQNKTVCLEKLLNGNNDGKTSESGIGERKQAGKQDLCGGEIEKNGFAKFCKEYVSKSVSSKPVLSPPSFGFMDSVNRLASVNREAAESAAHCSIPSTSNSPNKPEENQIDAPSSANQQNIQSLIRVLSTQNACGVSGVTEKQMISSCITNEKKSGKTVVVELSSNTATLEPVSVTTEGEKKKKSKRKRASKRRKRQNHKIGHLKYLKSSPSSCDLLLQNESLGTPLMKKEVGYENSNYQEFQEEVQEVQEAERNINTMFLLPSVTDVREANSVNTMLQVPSVEQVKEDEHDNSMYHFPSLQEIQDALQNFNMYQVPSVTDVQEACLVNTMFQVPSVKVQVASSVDTMFQIPSLTEVQETESFNTTFFQVPSVAQVQEGEHDNSTYQLPLVEEAKEAAQNISTMFQVPPLGEVKEMGRPDLNIYQTTSVGEVQESSPVISGQFNITQSPSGLKFQVSGEINTKDRTLSVEGVQISGNVRIRQATSAEGVCLLTDVNVMPLLSEGENTKTQHVLLLEEEAGSVEHDDTTIVASVERINAAEKDNPVQLPPAGDVQEGNLLYANQIPSVEGVREAEYLNTMPLPLTEGDVQEGNLLYAGQMPSVEGVHVAEYLNTMPLPLTEGEVQGENLLYAGQMPSVEGVHVAEYLNTMPLPLIEGDVQEGNLLYAGQMPSVEGVHVAEYLNTMPLPLTEGDVEGGNLLYASQIPPVEGIHVAEYLNTTTFPPTVEYREVEHLQTSQIPIAAEVQVAGNTDVMLSLPTEEIQIEDHADTSTSPSLEEDVQVSELVNRSPSTTAVTVKEAVSVDTMHQVTSSAEHQVVGDINLLPLQSASEVQEDEILTKHSLPLLQEPHDVSRLALETSEVAPSADNKIGEYLLRIYTPQKYSTGVDEAIKSRAAELIEKGIYLLSDTGSFAAILNPNCVAREQGSPGKCNFASTFNHYTMLPTQYQQKIIERAREEGLDNRVVSVEDQRPTSPVVIKTLLDSKVFEDCDGDQIMEDALQPRPTSYPYTGSHLDTLHQPDDSQSLQTVLTQMMLYLQQCNDFHKEIDVDMMDMMSDGQESFMETDIHDVTQVSLMECEDCTVQVTSIQSSSFARPYSNQVLEKRKDGPIPIFGGHNERLTISGFGNSVHQAERPVQLVLPSKEENQILQKSLIANYPGLQVTTPALANSSQPSFFSLPCDGGQSVLSNTTVAQTQSFPVASNEVQTTGKHEVIPGSDCLPNECTIAASRIENQPDVNRQQHVITQVNTTSSPDSTAPYFSVSFADKTLFKEQDTTSNRGSDDVGTLEHDQSRQESEELRSVLLHSTLDPCASIDVETLLDESGQTAQDVGDQSSLILVNTFASLDRTISTDSDTDKTGSLTEGLSDHYVAYLKERFGKQLKMFNCDLDTIIATEKSSGSDTMQKTETSSNVDTPASFSTENESGAYTVEESGALSKINSTEELLDRDALCLNDELNPSNCQTFLHFGEVMPNSTTNTSVVYNVATDSRESSVSYSTATDCKDSIDEEERYVAGNPSDVESARKNALAEALTLMASCPNENQTESCSKQPLAPSTVPHVSEDSARTMVYRRKIILLRKRDPISSADKKVFAVDDLFGEDRRPSTSGLQPSRLSGKKRLREILDDDGEADSSTEFKRRRRVHFSDEVQVCGDAHPSQNHPGSLSTNSAVPRKGILKNAKGRMAKR